MKRIEQAVERGARVVSTDTIRSRAPQPSSHVSPWAWILPCLGVLLVLGIIIGARSGKDAGPSGPETGVRDKTCSASEQFVRAKLKAPATAKFQSCDSRIIFQDGATWHTSGYVDAQNGFGALIRSHWESTMVREPGQFRDLGTTVQ